MTHDAVSPLRRRMIEDMTIRQFGGKTKSDYIRQVHKFAVFLGHSPDRAEPEDLRRYQLHMASCGASYARMNLAATALRFFFHTTLGWTGFGDRLARIPSPERLPVVLSPEEVALLLAHAPSLKYRAALSVAYGCGLRVSEIANLKVTDIDSARMLIRVEQGKGRKDRFVMLAPDLLDLLRQWWRVKRPRGWLFPGQQPAQPITTRQLNRACHAAAEAAKLGKRVSMHTLRHSFATHLLERKTDIRVIQVLLGHRKLDTTAIYTRVALKAIREVTSPLALLALPPPP
jgi:integrase/recombinase XerD